MITVLTKLVLYKEFFYLCVGMEKHDAAQVFVQGRDNSDSQLQGSLFRFSDNQENKNKPT